MFPGISAGESTNAQIVDYTVAIECLISEGFHSFIVPTVDTSMPTEGTNP